jgi:hypothetical protein
MRLANSADQAGCGRRQELLKIDAPERGPIGCASNITVGARRSDVARPDRAPHLGRASLTASKKKGSVSMKPINPLLAIAILALLPAGFSYAQSSPAAPKT